MKKRLVSLLLAVVMTVGMIPFGAIPAFAADTYPIVLEEPELCEIADVTYDLTGHPVSSVFEITDGAIVVFRNVTFRNVSGGDGCCVYIDLTDAFSMVEFHNCRFINCTSSGNGIVYVNNICSPYTDVTFDDCTIENCHADGYGGFLYVNDGDAEVIFNRTTFLNCSAKCGGVEYIQSSNYPSQYNDCTVTGCTASGDGGFAYMNDAEAVIRCSNTLISDCSADDGGAFYMDNGTSLVFENGCVLQNCRAESEGGAIYINDADGVIYGNGIHYEGEAAPDKSMAAVISGCSAEYGGGVYIAKGSIVNNLVFADNVSAYKGGGLFNNSEGDARCRIMNCRFIHNKCGDNENNKRSGGGLYVDDSNGEVFACEFYENEAYESGADLYANCTVSECIFTGIFGDNEGTKVVDKSKESNSKIRFAEVFYTFDGKGSGTESDPYRIENIHDWDTLYFRTESGKATDDTYYRLDADLTVEFTVGKTGDGCFRGHFDGNHHSLKVVRGGDDVNVGAFGFVRNAEIRDLTVTGTIRGRSAVGGFVGNASGCAFTNCVNYADITCSSGNAGGIAGQAAGGATFTNCENFADVTGSDAVGGIVGNLFLSDLAESDQSVTFYVCRSFGGVRAVSNVGGLVGRIADESESYQCVFTFTNCIHCGSVTGIRYAGGILGREETAVSLRNVHSFGSVSASLDAHGISGVSADGSDYELCLYNRDDCPSDENGIGVSRDTIYGRTAETVGETELRMPDYVNDYINENGKTADGWLYLAFDGNGLPEYVSGDAAIAVGTDGLLHDFSASYGGVTILDENTAVLGELAMFGEEPVHKKIYLVTRDIHRTGRIKIYEDVLLIINDGCEYTVDGGIDLADTSVPYIKSGYREYVNRPAVLTVTTKSLGDNMGKLTVKATNPGDAAIGGNSGRVDVNWELPSVSDPSGGTLNVFGGTVTVKGNCENSVGIGGGAGVISVFESTAQIPPFNPNGGNGCTVNVYHGKLDVTAGKNAVGIGGGKGYDIENADPYHRNRWVGIGGDGGSFRFFGGEVRVRSDLTAFGYGLGGDGTKTDGSTAVSLASGISETILCSDSPDCNYTAVRTGEELARLSEKRYAVITSETELITELTRHVHQYDAEYVWSEDYSSCTATGVCPLCPEETEGHSASATVSTVSQHYFPCLRYDYTVYTADFGGLFPTQEKSVQGSIVSGHTWIDTGDNEEHRCASCGVTRKHSFRAISVDADTYTVTSRCKDCGREITNAACGDIAFIAAEKGAYIDVGNLYVDRVVMTVDVHGAGEYWFGGIGTQSFFEEEPVRVEDSLELANTDTCLSAKIDEQDYSGDLLEPGMHTVELSVWQLKIDNAVVHEFEVELNIAGLQMALFAQKEKYINLWISTTEYFFHIPDWQSTVSCYGCSMYSEGELVRYYIPYVNETGEAGLYDLVEGKFYGNNGSGKITAYCTVSFDMNGYGTQVEPIDVEYGKTLTRPADPTAEGYTFEGWFKDKEGTEPWDFENDVVTSSTGLYAKWTKTVLHPDASGRYHVNSAADWKTFDSMVKDGYSFAGETVVLDGDITVTNLVGGFNSISALDRPFCGTFDGQNHTVTIAFDWDNGSDKGAFSHTNGGAVIKNLSVNTPSYKDILKGDWSVGGIVGNAANTTFINCTSFVSVRGAVSENPGHMYAGGIAGYACDGTRFMNCTCFGDVHGNQYVGGIAGLADSGTVFENCLSYGNVTGSQYVGGIVGGVSTNRRGNFVAAILNCIADGPVTGDGKSGGIIGGESGPVSVKNAHFFGSLSSSTDAKGITGSSDSDSYYENCFYNKYCPADAHGTGLDITDIPDAANDYIIEHNKTAEAWHYLGFDENGRPVFIDCIHNRGCTVSYEWDGDSCTATLVCDNCHIVLESETLSGLTPIVFDAPDCRTTGYYYYAADFENELFETQESEKTETVPGPHCYENYICQYCPAEDWEGARADAIKAINAAADHSEDAVVNLLASTATDAIDGAEKVADVLKIKNDTVSKISAIKTIIAAAGENPSISVKWIVEGAKEDIKNAESVEDVISIRDEYLASIETLTGHTHTFANTYNFNDTHHWHASTCGHSVVDGFGVHEYEVVTKDGVSTYTCACGYQKTVKTGDNEGEIIGGISYTGVSLTLGSDISVNFYMNLPEEARQNGKMTFDIGGRKVENVAVKQNPANERFFFACPITALEMNETITAKFTYDSVDYIQNYSVLNYIEVILNGRDQSGNPYSDEMRTLARKIANYGYYAQIYLESIHTNVTIVDSGEGYDRMEHFGVTEEGNFDIDAEKAIEALAAYGVSVSGASDLLSFYGSTVYFDSATALNYYVTVMNGEMPTATAVNTVTKQNKNVEIKRYRDNTYIVSVKDIIATELADEITVSVNGGLTVTGSVFAYCNSVVKAHSGANAGKTTEERAKDEKAINAMAAFWEYHKAAVAYVRTKA